MAQVVSRVERAEPNANAVVRPRDVGSISVIKRSLEKDTQPTPLFLLWRNHGQRSLGSQSPQDLEPGTFKWLSMQHAYICVNIHA